MNPIKAQALTLILRTANPWLVGHNFGRVAPIFFLNSLVRDCGPQGASVRVGRILDLLNGVDPADIQGLPLPIERADDISIALRGALASDRRAFRTTTGSGLLPVNRGLIMPSGSDDGLGRHVRQLIASSTVGEDFLSRLGQIFSEGHNSGVIVEDPVSRLGRLLAGTVPTSVHVDSAADDSPQGYRQTEYDNQLATFVVNAFRTGTSIQRISSIRSLALAGYMVSVLRMLQGPLVAESGEPRLLIAYAGLPPGRSQEPSNLAAISSFRSFIRASWKSMLNAAEAAILGDGLSPGSQDDPARRLRQGLVVVLNDLATRLKLAEAFSDRSGGGSHDSP